jgi:sugar-specific transcriptional regulator TrmB
VKSEAPNFLTSHGEVLLSIADDSEVRQRDIALNLGITERRVYGIVNDLTKSGYLIKEKHGRRVRYHIQDRFSLPEALIQDRTIGAVLGVLTKSDDRGPVERPAKRRGVRPH